MSEEGAIYKRLYVQALEERDALRARAEKAEAALKESLMREAAGADCRVALRLRAERAEARSVELEAGLSTCIGWIATMGVGPRINEVLQEARAALASVRPAPAQEEDIDAMVLRIAREISDYCVPTDGGRMVIKAQGIAALKRALLARKPAEERWPEVGE